MAEIAVTVVIDRLFSLLTEEARLLRGVHTEVEDIKRALLFIQAFLKDADAKAEKGDAISHGLKAWVQELRETAYSIEDLVDEYIHHFANRPRRSGVIFDFLSKVYCLIAKLKPRHELASKVKDLKLKVGKLKEESSSYGFISSFEHGSGDTINVPWHDPGVISLFIEEAEIVGIESPMSELINWLVEGAQERTVISVVGMGGLGKTTLAKKVYDNKQIVERFVCRAWITVSQSFKMEMVLKNMIKKFYEAMKEPIPEGMDAMDEISLIGLLKKYLEDKRYAIVFDDVWRLEFWGFIKYVLPENRRGSRVVITTRNVEVGCAIRESRFHHIHNLQPLLPESSWELFCKKAFQGSCCPSELKKISTDIVKRCAGLPLAIVAIGGALSTKQKNELEWQKFNDKLGSQLETNPHLESITKILSLSYNDLPHFLKPCFLYCAVFPEDYSINCAKLIRLWVAEGFVKGEKGVPLEQRAEEYLNELIHRSLVQLPKVDDKGRITRCKVHDLMREIILKKAEELSFCHVLGDEDLSFNGKFRRGSVQKGTNTIAVETIHRNAQIRSLLLFDSDAVPMLLTGISFTNFKLLKVLDFEDAPLDSVPKDLGNLFHLRYLSLRGTKVKMLPKSIGKLQNLQTLDLKHSPVDALPVEITKLKKLRHILAYSYQLDPDAALCGGYWQYARGVHIGEGIGSMLDLQKLCFVEANNGRGLIEELGKLRQLRRLGIVNLMEEDGPSMCASISNMKYLESLVIFSKDDGILNLQTISDPPRYLRILTLQGGLSRLPDWLPVLQNLVRVALFNSRLSYDPMEILQALPNLLELVLSNAYGGECFCFTELGFQKLKVLRLYNMKGVKTLKIHEGALPVLERLEIQPSPQMEVPSGIRLLKTLTRIDFFSMPREYACSMRPQDGQNYHIVEHVPNIFFHEFHADGHTILSLR